MHGPLFYLPACTQYQVAPAPAWLLVACSLVFPCSSSSGRNGKSTHRPCALEYRTLVTARFPIQTDERTRPALFANDRNKHRSEPPLRPPPPPPIITAAEQSGSARTSVLYFTHYMVRWTRTVEQQYVQYSTSSTSSTTGISSDPISLTTPTDHNHGLTSHLPAYLPTYIRILQSCFSFHHIPPPPLSAIASLDDEGAHR